MSEAPYMQLYVGDYLGDTRHLTTEQHGAYLLLLMAMWTSDGILPNDEAKLARMAGLSVAKWRKIGPDVLEFFTVEGATVTQKRLKKEREKWEKKSEARREAGKRGGTAKSLKEHEAAVANATANATDLPQQNPSIFHIPDCREEASSNEDADARRAPAPPKATPRSELEAVLSPEMAGAVIDHRRAKGAKLTVKAAQGLAKKLAQWPDPHEAAEEMIVAGWTGFEPEWLKARKQARGQAPPRNGNGHETPWQRQRRAFEELDDEISQPAGPERAFPGLPKPGAH